jgi:hypothetical protein
MALKALVFTPASDQAFQVSGVGLRHHNLPCLQSAASAAGCPPEAELERNVGCKIMMHDGHLVRKPIHSMEYERIYEDLWHNMGQY